jgi:hypothetical protein
MLVTIMQRARESDSGETHLPDLFEARERTSSGEIRNQVGDRNVTPYDIGNIGNEISIH